jgi:GLPGLI family protein
MVKIFMRTIFLLITVCSLSGSLFAQQQFITKGKIEYERKTNQHALMDDNSLFDDLAKKSLPKFVTYYYDLTFKDGRSLYKPGRDADTKQNRFWGLLDADNVILSNLDSSTCIAQKSIFGDMYLISDSLRKIDWKISTEMRKIAGFDCRKAVGKVLDSIIVVAFYTDEILPPGGPESFTGLPGMILGLAIPKMHTTLYATKLQIVDVTDKDLAAPRKGKKYQGKDFRGQIKDIMKDWGDQGTKLQWQIML